ncbi:ethanolamine kinase 2 isoform X3 [Aptenodytes patagonicus]|uniref:ethanolamine kinase 2 isoform X3 n=1 Tax=Aptenodytes patagonicus TaxID=9234 RepID=UPI003F9ECDC4
MTRDVPSRDVPAYQRPSPAGRVGRRRWGGGGVCSVLFAVWGLVWFCFFFSSFCDKRFAQIFWERFPGPLRCQACWQHIWPELFLSSQLFTDGITNKLVACYTDEGMADAVLVRVYGRKTELFVDRETELRSFQVLRAHGCAPDLYCAFQNGLCYQFLPGIALGPDHVRDPHIFRLVAQEMARVHAIHANGSLPKPILWQKLHKYLTLVKTDLSPKVSNPSLQQDVPSLEMLEHELAWMKETLSQLGSPIVLCHNDLLCKNIIYDRTQEHIRFIDYEYTGYNYQAFDIGNHFNEFAGLQATHPGGPRRHGGVRGGAGGSLRASEQVFFGIPFPLGMLGPDPG